MLYALCRGQRETHNFANWMNQAHLRNLEKIMFLQPTQSYVTLTKVKDKLSKEIHILFHEFKKPCTFGKSYYLIPHIHACNTSEGHMCYSIRMFPTTDASVSTGEKLWTNTMNKNYEQKLWKGLNKIGKNYEKDWKNRKKTLTISRKTFLV